VTAAVGLILVAAGSSRRMGSIDKVWAALDGRPVLCHSLHRLAPLVRDVVVVIHPDGFDKARDLLVGPNIGVVTGGAERRHSVANGLRALPDDLSAIAVHDAARPLVPPRLLTDALSLLDRFDGAVPALPISATVKEVAGGRIVRTIDRSHLQTAQTPQVFRAAALRSLYSAVDLDLSPVTDDAGLAELAGLTVAAFPGAEQNFKITTPYDLELARLLLSAGLAG